MEFQTLSTFSQNKGDFSQKHYCDMLPFPLNGGRHIHYNSRREWLPSMEVKNILGFAAAITGHVTPYVASSDSAKQSVFITLSATQV